MIKAIYYRKYHRLVVEGHAQSAEVGHDLVCASASILAYTLALNVANMVDNGKVINHVIDNTSGKSEISCSPRSSLKNSVTLVFDSVCAGFELLAHNYPDYVSYEIR